MRYALEFIINNSGSAFERYFAQRLLEKFRNGESVITPGQLKWIRQTHENLR